jgi:hypothetical protein
MVAVLKYERGLKIGTLEAFAPKDGTSNTLVELAHLVINLLTVLKWLN